MSAQESFRVSDEQLWCCLPWTREHSQAKNAEWQGFSVLQKTSWQISWQISVINSPSFKADSSAKSVQVGNSRFIRNFAWDCVSESPCVIEFLTTDKSSEHGSQLSSTSLIGFDY